MLRDHPKKRSRHLLSDPYKYYLAIVNDVVLRFGWVAKLGLEGVIDSNLSQLLFGAVEIMRRGFWNIFRMENEQVNNCGKFRCVLGGGLRGRATLEVPVPFPDLMRFGVCWKQRELITMTAKQTQWLAIHSTHSVRLF